MKKMNKKLLLVLSMLALVVAFCFSVSAAGEIHSQGEVGDSATYVLYTDGELVISGTGEVESYSPITDRENINVVKNVVIKEGITSLGNRVFEDCINLTSVSLPSTLKELGDSVFSGCTSLKKIVIPEGIETIGGHIFYGCTSLSSVTLPKTLTYIREHAFNSCSSLVSIKIPDAVTSVREYAFSNCTSLKNITFGKGMTFIAQGCFKNCTSLTKLVLPEGIEFMNEDAFKGCSKLESLTLPSTLTKIGRHAMEECNFKTFVIPKSVTNIDFGSIPVAKTLVVLNKELIVDSTDFESYSSIGVIVAYPDTNVANFAKNNNVKFRSIYCEAPVLSKAVNTANGIKITWKKSEGATKYVVLRKASGDKKWTAVTTVKAGVLSYEDKKATAGKVYDYSVRADNDWEKGYYNDKEPLPVKRLTQTKLTAKTTAKGVALSWSKVKGASEYIVYRDGKKIATVAGASYTDKTAQYKKTHSYTVAATAVIPEVRVTAAQSAAVKVTVKYVSPVELTATVTAKSTVKLTWDSVLGADSYQVYRSTSADKGFKKITTVKKGTSYTDKKLSYGKTYYYKVVTVDGKKKATSEAVKIAATIPAAQFKTADVTAKTVTLKWDKVKEASGYDLYIKSGKSWKKIKSITKNSTTSFKYSTEAGGTFKIVAFAKSGGKTYKAAETTAVFKTLKKTSSVKVSQFDGKFVDLVEWKAVDKAVMYEVYRKIGDGKWKKVDTVYGTKYKSEVTHGKYYYWGIKAVYENEGKKSVGEMVKSTGYMISYNPNFTVWVSKEYSGARTAMFSIKNNGPCTIRIKNQGRIWNGSNYPNLNGKMRLVDQNLNSLKYQDIAPGESTWVFFYIEAAGSYYNKDTMLFFDFSYDGVDYEAHTTTRKIVNMCEYSKAD